MKRASGIYTDDKNQEYRCSHENPFIKKLYEDYLGKPLSEKSHKLLHTHYKPRPLYNR
ncbi:MAG: iron hydrogenase small subunit [Brevinematales bacterium]|nr:iron hydrogenase small subunit [Brevinematales bacterium]